MPQPDTRTRQATPTEAYALGVVQAALEHQRNRGGAFALTAVAASYGHDGIVTGELSLEIGGRRFTVTVSDRDVLDQPGDGPEVEY